MNVKSLSVSLVAATLAAASWAFATTVPDTGAPAPVGPVTHLAVGTVRSVDADGVTIGHQAIPSLGMPAMTMQFRVSPSHRSSLEPGQTIAFMFAPSAEGLTIQSVQRVEPRMAGGRDAGTAMPGNERDAMSGMQGMHGMQGMQGMHAMMESCHRMMGGR